LLVGLRLERLQIEGSDVVHLGTERHTNVLA
jgi:hypothetical protein